jgi:hypothetical protein
MYVWFWRHLPGARWVRALWVFVIFSLLVFVLFQYAFPWVEPRLPFSGNGSVGD